MRRNLAAFQPREVRDRLLVRAAVAVLIVADDGGEACLPICLRPSRLRSHPGQLALPGGRLDPGEDHRAALLRELEEELAVRATEAQVLGTLDDFPTRSGFAIRPLVVWGGSAGELAPSPSEIAQLFSVPLAAIESADGIRFAAGSDPDAPLIQIPLPFAVVHAPTAAILFQFREVALNGRETRVAHYAQPRFTWR